MFVPPFSLDQSCPESASGYARIVDTVDAGHSIVPTVAGALQRLPADRGCWWATAAVAGLLFGFPPAVFALSAVTGDLQTDVLPQISADARIRRAVALLPTRPGVLIEVVDSGKLPKPLRRQVRDMCAFVFSGVPRIHVLSTCPAYKGALASLFEAIKLAAALQHEMAHLEGANEHQARLAESRVFRELVLRWAPASDFTAAMWYAAAIDRAAAAVAGKRRGHPGRPSSSPTSSGR
jgi:hypothetical protein